jgi:hypothetical protein
MLSLSVLACWIVIWSTWSLIGQSDGLFWFKSQFSAISGDRSYYATLNSLDLFLRISFSWIGYLIGFIGALTYIISIGIRKVIEKRIVEETLDEEESNKKLLTVDQFLLVIIGLIIIRIILILIFDLIPINDPRFLLIDLHLVGLLVPSWIIAYQHFKESIKLISPNNFFIKTKSIKRTNLFGSIFVFLIFFSHFWSQLPVMVNQAYIVTPEKEAGLFLQAYITSKYSSQFTPKIFIDSPVVAYYANLEVHQMISSEWIDIFNPLNTLITTNIRILVLHDVPYSKGYSYFNFLTANPAFITKEKTNFTRIFQYDGWELQYGAKPVVIYWLDHS